jgi:hypothetical protein
MYGAEGGRGHKKEETLSAGMRQALDQNRAADEAAKLIGVSPRYIQEAKAIAKEAPTYSRNRLVAVFCRQR